MTTIAYRDGVIASDSRLVMGDQICIERGRKLYVSQRHAAVYGIAGHYTKAAALVRDLELLPAFPWVSGKQFELVGQEDTCEILIAQHDRKVFYFADNHWVQMSADFTAIGSGAQAANAAMIMGASAIEAIKIAAQVDLATDDQVAHFDVAHLAPPARVKRTPTKRTPAKRKR